MIQKRRVYTEFLIAVSDLALAHTEQFSRKVVTVVV